MPGVADDEGAERLAVGDEAEPGVQAPELRQEGRRIGALRDAGEDEHRALDPRWIPSDPGAGRLEGLVEPTDALGRGEHAEAEALVDRPVADRDQESQAPRRDPLRAGDDLREVRRVPVMDEAERADRDPPRAG